MPPSYLAKKITFIVNNSWQANCLCVKFSQKQQAGQPAKALRSKAIHPPIPPAQVALRAKGKRSSPKLERSTDSRDLRPDKLKMPPSPLIIDAIGTGNGGEEKKWGHQEPEGGKDAKTKKLRETRIPASPLTGMSSKTTRSSHTQRERELRGRGAKDGAIPCSASVVHQNLSGIKFNLQLAALSMSPPTPTTFA